MVCYRKATNLKRAQKNDAEHDRSDSTVYFQDMILCSEDSETDDGMFLYSRDRNVQILCSLLYKLQAALVDIQISVKRIAVDVVIPVKQLHLV